MQVRYAEPDHYLGKSTAPDDPDYVQQYALAPRCCAGGRHPTGVMPDGSGRATLL
jgi:hypothetical protein